jgi:hypothetical protein
MESIPIKFQCEAKKYMCHLSHVIGAGTTSCYHLQDDKNFYLGRLRWSEFENKWVFDSSPKTKDLEQLADYFGDVVTAWYQ